ncbi:CALCIUM BINDING PROTEIN [Salix purpurea]|uniref:CALCIUM BINDING PROTEIN n=1 Tax=Salix purpurea TaxID=77065 RepID=A0A9Q0ZMR5_SALPP|nr:CALCIUM BINDING PROTEIN [Salix purpurea]
METERVSKSSKWFSNKSLKLSLHRRRSKSSSTPSSPNSPTDGDGRISALELRAYFGSIGEYMSHEEASLAIHDLDADQDNLLDFQDFSRFMKREASDNDEDIKMAFGMFEMEKGSGCITPKGLQRMLRRLGDAKSYDECVAMIQAFDIDGNGVLDFYEFNQMMA